MECGVAVERGIAGKEAMGGAGIGVWICKGVDAGVGVCCWKAGVGYCM